MSDYIPLRPVKRLIKDNGADRVSDRAVELMTDELESIAEDRARDADKWRKHAGRKTVQAEDVKSAFE